MSTVTIDTATETGRTLNPEQKAMLKRMNNWFMFKLFALKDLPMGFLSGMAIKHLDQHGCTSTVPYRWLNRNPFQSTYFAVLAMAAELTNGSLALLAVLGHNPSVAVIITGVKANFTKKATDTITFVCEDGDLLFDAVERAAETGESVEQPVTAIGRMPDGTIVAEFTFNWSFKRRDD